MAFELSRIITAWIDLIYLAASYIVSLPICSKTSILGGRDKYYNIYTWMTIEI